MLISLDQYPSSPDVEIGELLFVVSVSAANVVNDIRENIRNLVGGRMHHYEKLIERAVAQGLADLDAKAKAKGYDGVIGVKIANPTVVEGGVEVIVYGNGFRRRVIS
ncbi:MAG: heavy metal-binding domain-containing protein [Caldilineaceae bacterium]